MAKKVLTYPDYIGRALTNGQFVEMMQRHVALLTAYGLEALGLAERMATLQAALAELQSLIKLVMSWELTPEVAQGDKARDGLVRVLIYMITVLAETLPEGDELGDAARKLLPTARTYKGSAKSEMTQETTELNGLLKALMSGEEEPKHLQKLGATKLVSALMTYNQKTQEAMAKREQEQGARIEKRDGKSTADVREEVKEAYLSCVRRVNAKLDDMAEPTDAARKLAADAEAVVQHYRNIASTHHKKSQGDDGGGDVVPDTAADTSAAD